jgi:hypothetical protein
LIQDSSKRLWNIRKLKDSQIVLKGNERDVILVYIDPSSLPDKPGWFLRNALFWLGKRYGLNTIRVLCYREHVKEHDIGDSLLMDIDLPEEGFGKWMTYYMLL